ncbi:restriction endonuclease subunit S [Acinetobacter baumannii]
MEKQKCPELRFSQFKDEWYETTLGDVVDIVGGGTPDTNVPEFWNGDIDWYSPTEIGENVYANGSTKKITALGLKNSSAKILPAKKTVLFSSRAGIGDMAILDKPAATNQGFQSFVANNIDVYFLYSMGVKIKKFALSKASGSTFLEISRNQLAQMEFLAPSIDSNEQTQIGNFFQKIDQSIALHEKKLVQTQNLKKAMLEKMFPKAGSTQPEIRLKGFSGGWDSYSIFSLAQNQKLNNGVFNDQNKVGKGYKLINVLDMYIETSIDESKLTLLDLDRKEFEQNKVKYGDIFFTRSSLVKEGIAFSNVYLGHSNDITYDGHLIKLSPNLELVDPDFSKLLFEVIKS